MKIIDQIKFSNFFFLAYRIVMLIWLLICDLRIYANKKKIPNQSWRNLKNSIYATNKEIKQSNEIGGSRRLPLQILFVFTLLQKKISNKHVQIFLKFYDEMMCNCFRLVASRFCVRPFFDIWYGIIVWCCATPFRNVLLNLFGNIILLGLVACRWICDLPMQQTNKQTNKFNIFLSECIMQQKERILNQMEGGSRRLPLQINDNPEDDTPLLTGKPKRFVDQFIFFSSQLFFCESIEFEKKKIFIFWLI